jgi:sigma-B regulation protein RsbU (phosphoserine phosphatase)
MSQSGFTGELASNYMIDVQTSTAPRQNSGIRARQQELELKLAALQKDYVDLHSALFEAAQVHRRLCAPRLVRYGDFEIASEIFAVRHLPGDFFAVEESSTGIILALGDICGKGLAAGMWTTHLVGLVRTHTAASAEPQAIAAGVNRDICRMSGLVPLASLFLAKLDPASGRLDYSNAGHPPALLLRADGQVESLSEGGPLLGAVPAASYAGRRVDLSAGDVLLAYSDGIVESRNNADQEFGCERLETELRRTRTASAEAVLFSILGAVQDFAAASPLADDMSLVVVRCGAAAGHVQGGPFQTELVKRDRGNPRSR